MAKLWNNVRQQTAGHWMAAICHTLWMLDSTELDKWKWARRHMRSRAEQNQQVLTRTQLLTSTGDTSQHICVSTRAFDDSKTRVVSLFTVDHESFTTWFNSSLFKSHVVSGKVTRWLQSGLVSIDADYNRSAEQKHQAWTSAGALQWMEGEQFRSCGRLHSQSRSCERFGGRWRDLTRTLAGFDWRSPNWTRAAGCCPPRDSAFSIWSSCSETRFSPAFRSDSETGPGSAFHTLRGTASCETCSPKPPVARTWTPSWRAWAWRRPARSAGVCSVWDRAGWPLDLHCRVSRWGRTPLQPAGRGAPAPHRALRARRVESVRLLPPLKHKRMVTFRYI